MGILRQSTGAVYVFDLRNLAEQMDLAAHITRNTAESLDNPADRATQLRYEGKAEGFTEAANRLLEFIHENARQMRPDAD